MCLMNYASKSILPVTQNNLNYINERKYMNENSGENYFNWQKNIGHFGIWGELVKLELKLLIWPGEI